MLSYKSQTIFLSFEQFSLEILPIRNLNVFTAYTGNFNFLVGGWTFIGCDVYLCPAFKIANGA